MESFYANSKFESMNYDAKRSAREAGFINENGSLVPLPEELTQMFKPLECELCGVLVASEVTAYTHYEGKTHMKNVNAYMKEQYNIHGSMKKFKLEFSPHQCEVCKCDLSSLIQAQLHYSGKLHKKNIRKIHYDPLNAVPLQPAEKISMSELLKDLPPPPPPPVLSDFVCEICNVTTNTVNQLNIHKNGSKHQKKLKRLKESESDCGSDGPGYYSEQITLNYTYSDNQVYATAEPIVTDYLPLSNEPLCFDNLQCNYGPQNSNIDYQENGESGELCIKLSNNKTEDSTPRLLEGLWVEKFNRSIENDQLATIKPQNFTEELTTDNQSICHLHPNRPDSSINRTCEASLDIAKLPQFSVAAVLPQLQAALSTPHRLSTNEISNYSFNKTEDEASPQLETQISTINFKEIKVDCSFRMSQLNILTPIGNHVQDEEISCSNKYTSNSSSQNSKPTSVCVDNKIELLSRENGRSLKTKSLAKLSNSSEDSIHGAKNGKFIIDNWETIQEMKSDNYNNKTKKLTNFLLAFKKELNKKRSENVANNLTKNEPYENVSPKQSPENKEDAIRIIDDKINKNDTIILEKKTNNSEVVSESERENATKEKFLESRKATESKNQSDNETHTCHLRKERIYKKDRDKISTRNHLISSDYHQKQEDYKNLKDEYKRYRDSDDGDDYKEAKRRHKYYSRMEKETYESHRNKKSSRSPTFIHKKSHERRAISYLAPPSDWDSKDITMYRTPSGLYYCTFCDYSSSHCSKFTDHLYSRSHRDQKRKTAK